MKYKAIKYNKDGKAMLPQQTIQMLNEGGFISTRNANTQIRDKADAYREELADEKSEKIKRGFAGVGAGVLAAGSIVLAGASFGAAAPLAAAGLSGAMSLGKYAAKGGKKGDGQLAEGVTSAGMAGANSAMQQGSGTIGDSPNLRVDASPELSQKGLPNFNTELDIPPMGLQPQTESIQQFMSGGKMFGSGGSMAFTTSVIDDDFMELKGNTHNGGGIPFSEGVEVEGGETIWKEFVFTNSHKATKAALKANKLPASYAGQTYAKISKKMHKYREERPNDPYARESFDDMMTRLQESHLTDIPQSRPENIQGEVDNAGIQGFPPQARNGGSIVSYVSSVPFKSGGNTKYADGGDLKALYFDMELLLRSQLDTNMSGIASNSSEGTGDPFTFDDNIATQFEAIKNLPEEEQLQSLSNLYTYIVQNTSKDLPEGINYQLLDRISSEYPSNSSIARRPNEGNVTEPGSTPASDATADAADPIITELKKVEGETLPFPESPTMDLSGVQDDGQLNPGMVPQNPQDPNFSGVAQTMGPDYPTGKEEGPENTPGADTRTAKQKRKDAKDPMYGYEPSDKEYMPSNLGRKSFDKFMEDHEDKWEGFGEDYKQEQYEDYSKRTSSFEIPSGRFESSRDLTIAEVPEYNRGFGKYQFDRIAYTGDYGPGRRHFGTSKHVKQPQKPTYLAPKEVRLPVKGTDTDYYVPEAGDLDLSVVSRDEDGNEGGGGDGSGGSGGDGSAHKDVTPPSTQPGDDSFKGFGPPQTNIPDDGGGRSTPDDAPGAKKKRDLSFLRYAPVVASAANLAMVLGDKPVPKNAADFQSNYKYKRAQIDKELLQREVDTQSADLRNTISQGATNQSSLMAGIAGISAGTAKGKNAAVMQGQMFDAQEEQRVQGLEGQQDQFNQKVGLQVAGMNDGDAAAYTSNLMDSLSSMGSNIGAIGTDEQNKGFADKMYAYDTKGNYANPGMAPNQGQAAFLASLNEEQKKLYAQSTGG